MLTAQQIHEKSFSRDKKGYNIDEVDIFLDEVIVDYDDNYPVLFNSENLTHFVVDSLKDQNISEVNNIVDLGPQNPSEDFSYYGQVVPSTFFYIGAQPEDGGNYPHHSPLFKMNEKSILIAAKAVATVTINYLFFNKKM